MPQGSHPASVMFGELELGELLSIRVSSPTAEIKDHPRGGRLIGAGGMARIMNRVWCTKVSPGACEIRFLGYPVFTPDDAGTVDDLAVDVAGNALTQPAILESWIVEAEVGELIRGSARFRFTGE